MRQDAARSARQAEKSAAPELRVQASRKFHDRSATSRRPGGRRSACRLQGVRKVRSRKGRRKKRQCNGMHYTASCSAGPLIRKADDPRRGGLLMAACRHAWTTYQAVFFFPGRQDQYTMKTQQAQHLLRFLFHKKRQIAAHWAAVWHKRLSRRGVWGGPSFS